MTQATILRAGSAVLILAAMTACSDSTSPTQLGSEARSAGSPRSGTFQVEKECSTYTGHRDELCTITSSTLPQIEPGTTITYASDAAGILLDTDVRLDAPGPGNRSTTSSPPLVIPRASSTRSSRHVSSSCEPHAHRV